MPPSGSDESGAHPHAAGDVAAPRPTVVTPRPQPEFDIVPGIPEPDSGLPGALGEPAPPGDLDDEFLLEFGAHSAGRDVAEGTLTADGRAVFVAQSNPEGVDFGYFLRVGRGPEPASLGYRLRTVVTLAVRVRRRLLQEISHADFWTVTVTDAECTTPPRDISPRRLYIRVRDGDRDRRLDFSDRCVGDGGLRALFNRLRMQSGAAALAESVPIRRIAAEWVREPPCISAVPVGGSARLEATLLGARGVDRVSFSGDLAETEIRECLVSRLRRGRWRGTWPRLPAGLSLVEVQLTLPMGIWPSPTVRRTPL